MRRWWKARMERLKIENWRDRVYSGKGPLVPRLELARPVRGEGPFLISAWSFQPLPDDDIGLIWNRPWGQLEVASPRWKRDSKHLVESFLGVQSHEELQAIDSSRFVTEYPEYDEMRGFYDKHMVVSVDWYKPQALDIQPYKGADRSASGVPELGRSVALEVTDGRVHLQISAADFADMIEELLGYSAVVSTMKLKPALTLLAEQGAVLREPEEM